MIKGYSFSGFEQYEQRFERLLIPARKRCSSFTMSIWHSPTPIRGKPARLELPRASQEQCKNEPGGWQDGVPSCRLHLRQVLDDEHSEHSHWPVCAVLEKRPSKSHRNLAEMLLHWEESVWRTVSSDERR